MDALVTQRCYICTAFFSDKVKLGLHIALCYADAVKRGVKNLPPPTDLLNDEKRYTEYMRDNHRQLQAQIEDARRQKVSFVTAEDFSALRNRIESHAQPPVLQVAAAAPTAKPRQIHAFGGGPTTNPATRFKRVNADDAAGGVISGGIHSPSGSPHGRSAVAQNPKLQSRDHTIPVTSEEAIHPNRVSTGVTMLRGELAAELANLKVFMAEEQQKALMRDKAYGDTQPEVESHVKRLPAVQTTDLSTPPQRGEPASPSPPRGHANSEQQQCPACGKWFGQRGYAVHTARCGKHATVDFTFSRDAQRPESRPAHRIPDEPNRCDPSLEHHRISDSALPASEPRRECRRCKRLFLASCAAQHEAVCVANPQR